MVAPAGFEPTAHDLGSQQDAELPLSARNDVEHED